MGNSLQHQGFKGGLGSGLGGPSSLQQQVNQAQSRANKRTKHENGSSNTLEDSYKLWSTKRDLGSMNKVIEASNSIMASAIHTYAASSAPSIKSKAKILTKKAIESFDPSKGAKLKTHIHNNLRPLYREAQSYNTVHIPERVVQDLSSVREWESKYHDEHGRPPNDTELADYSSLSKKRIAHIRKYDKNQLFEGNLIKNKEQGGDEDTGSGTESAKVTQAANLWEDYVYDGLAPTDKAIYELKLGKNNNIPRGVTFISKKLGISPSAVSQRLGKISEKISEGLSYDK